MSFTSRGQALEPILLELGRWGSREPVTPGAEMSVNALLLALKTVFDPAAAMDATFALLVQGEWFRVTVHGQSIDIVPGRTAEPTVTLVTDIPTLRSVAFGREPVIAAELDGRLTITGDRYAAERFARMFAVPGGPPASLTASAGVLSGRPDPFWCPGIPRASRCRPGSAPGCRSADSACTITGGTAPAILACQRPLTRPAQASQPGNSSAIAAAC